MCGRVWTCGQREPPPGHTPLPTHVPTPRSAWSSRAINNFSALAHLIGDLRSNMLASEVERMMFIRLNRNMVDEVRELDAANELARARVAKSAQKSAAAQKERSAWWLTLPYRCYDLLMCQGVITIFGLFTIITCWRLADEQLSWARWGDLVIVPFTSTI